MNFVETVVQQGQNVLNSMKDLKKAAKVKGEKRGAFIERFTANQHSFNVYTYADEVIKNSKEVSVFKEKLDLLNQEFDHARFDFEGEVNVVKVNSLYDEVLHAYNDMVTALGYEKDAVNLKKFK
jgi:hypothetical protein